MCLFAWINEQVPQELKKTNLCKSDLHGFFRLVDPAALPVLMKVYVAA